MRHMVFFSSAFMVFSLALVSVAGAGLAENWDGAEWTNGDTIPESPTASNGWTETFDDGATHEMEIIDGQGYNGTDGIRQQGDGGWSRISKSLPSPQTTGIFDQSVLVSPGSGTFVIQMHLRASTSQEVNIDWIFNQSRMVVAQQPSGTELDMVSGPTNSAGNWTELRMTFDLDSDSAIASWRDWGDTGTGPVGDYTSEAVPGGALTWDVAHVDIGIFEQSGNNARVDTLFSIIPEPSTLTLLGCGLLTLVGIRRRRKRE